MDDRYQFVESAEILPRRVNEPPAIFSGCTYRETKVMAISLFCFWIVFGVFVGFFTGTTLILLCGTPLFTFISVYVCAGWLRLVKAGKPVGYYEQKWRLFLERYRLSVSYLYQGSGVLETGRSKQYISKRRIKRSINEGDIAGTDYE